MQIASKSLCKNCYNLYIDHIEGYCLFAPTKFTHLLCNRGLGISKQGGELYACHCSMSLGSTNPHTKFYLLDELDAICQ